MFRMSLRMFYIYMSCVQGIVLPNPGHSARKEPNVTLAPHQEDSDPLSGWLNGLASSYVNISTTANGVVDGSSKDIVKGSEVAFTDMAGQTKVEALAISMDLIGEAYAFLNAKAKGQFAENYKTLSTTQVKNAKKTLKTWDVTYRTQEQADFWGSIVDANMYQQHDSELWKIFAVTAGKAHLFSELPAGLKITSGGITFNGHYTDYTGGQPPPKWQVLAALALQTLDGAMTKKTSTSSMELFSTAFEFAKQAQFWFKSEQAERAEDEAEAERAAEQAKQADTAAAAS